MSASQKVLIADDDTSIRLVLSQAFTRAGFQVRATGSAATLLKWVSEGEGDLVITDVLMPDENAFDVLPRLRKLRPQLPTIVMSAQNTLLTAVNAAQIGAFEYVPKPFDLDEMVSAARRALAKPADSARARAQARAVRDEGLPLIGRSPPMQEVYRTLARLVDTSLNVLITGEIGTGKELTAHALHDLGPRRDAAFVPVQMSGAPASQVDEVLMGAGPDPGGALVQADGGTLFFDEVGDLSLEAQSRLLRIVDGSARPTSPKTGRRVDVRIVAASSRDLRDLVRQGQFREELLLRLNVVPLRLPSLRERADDIPDLARAFLLRAHRDGLAAKSLDETAVQRLQRHSWPGNVRELENLMRRVAILYAEDPITARQIDRELQDEPRAAPASADGPATLEDLVERNLAGVFAGAPEATPPPGLYDRALESLERPLIRLTLQATRGNQIKAAEILGINRNTLRKKIEELGVEVARRRS